MTAQGPHRTEAHVIGSSPTAVAFDADVAVTMEGRSLFFIVGRDGPPDRVVQAYGGQIAARLADPKHVLAVAPLAAHSALRSDRALIHAGPVSLDPERFGRFAQIMGLDRR